MLKLIIFDMDGLMFDTEEVMCRAFLEVTGEKGHPGTRDQFLTLLGRNRQDITEKYKEFFAGAIDAESLYREGGERKLDIMKREGVPVKKGLKDLLAVISDLGLMKAVASSSDRDMILDNLEDTGLSDSFDLIVSGGELKRGKPWPDIFLTVCDKLQLAPEEALVLEDSENGVRAALAGHIPVVCVPDMLELPADLQDQCLAVCPSLQEVIPLIEKMSAVSREDGCD